MNVTGLPRQDSPGALPLPPGPRLPSVVQTVLYGSRRAHWLPVLRRRHGAVFRLNVLPQHNLVVLSDVAHIRAVFNGAATTFHAGEGNSVLGPLMGRHSVVLADEDDHLRVRKLLTPAFHGAALSGYRDTIAALAAEEIGRWPVGEPFRVHDRMRALTLEIIIQVVFGMGAGARRDELRRLLERIVAIGPFTLLGLGNPRLRRIGSWRRIAVAVLRVDDLLYYEIAERRRASDLRARTDVLSQLLAVPPGDDQLSDAEIRDQLVTLLLAGHETTATALAWSFHDLARDPVALRTATRAADEGDDRFLEAIVKEVMRLHPVISEVARKLTKDLAIGGYRIPAGWTVMPTVALVHHDASHHPDPSGFRPERFLDGGPPAGSWIPFGGGVRRCLGAGFSLLESTIVLRAVLSRYQLTARPRPEPVRVRNITLVPSRGAKMVVAVRRETTT